MRLHSSARRWKRIDRPALLRRRALHEDASATLSSAVLVFDVREVGPAGHFLGTAHTLEHFDKAFFMPTIMDFNSFEQWSADGAKDHDTRGRDKARAMLAAYEKPKMDEGITQALREFVVKRESELPNSVS